MLLRKALFSLSLLFVLFSHPSPTFGQTPSLEELVKKVETSLPWGDRVLVKFQITPQDQRLKEMLKNFDLGMVYTKPRLKIWMESSAPLRKGYIYFGEKGLYESDQTIYEYLFTDLSSIGTAERKDLFQNPLLVSGLFLFYPRYFLTTLGEVKKIETSQYEGKPCYFLSSPHTQIWYDQKTLWPLKISVHRSPTRGFDFFLKKMEPLGEKKFRILMDFQERLNSRSPNSFSSILHLDGGGNFKGQEATFLSDPRVMVRDREPKSLEEYQKILEKDPKNKRALYSLALQYHWTVKHKECLELLNKIRTLYPKAPQIYYYLLKIYHETNNYDQGDALLLDADKQEVPLSSSLCQLAARFYQKRGKFEKAAGILNKALKKDASPQLTWQLVHLYLQWPSHHPEALRILGEVLKQSSRPFPYGELKRVFQVLQKQGRAKTLEALVLTLSKGAPAHQKDLHFHKFMGWLYLEKQATKKAAEYYREALKLTKEGSWDHIEIAQKFLQMGLQKEGMEELKKILSGKGSPSGKRTAARHLLDHLLQKGNPKEIGPSFSQGGKYLDFRDLENWTYQLTRKLKLEDLEKLIRLWEGEKEKHQGHYYVLGAFYTSQKDLPKGLDNYLKTYEISGHSEIIRRVFKEIKKSKEPQLLQKAIHLAEKKKTPAAQNPEFLHLLGKALLERGRVKEGISFLKKGAQLGLKDGRSQNLQQVLDMAETLSHYREYRKESLYLATQIRELVKGIGSYDQRKPLSLMIRLYCLDDQYEEALKASLEIHSLGGFWNLYQLIGVLQKANKLEKFVQFLEGQAQKKGSRSLYWILGEIQASQSLHLSALQWYLKGLQTAMEPKYWGQFLSALERAQWTLEKADPKVRDRLMDQTEKLLSTLSEKEKAQRVLGKLYYQFGQRQKALGLLEQSLSESVKKQGANELYLLMNLFYQFKLYEQCFKAAQGVLTAPSYQNQWHRTEARKILLKIAAYQKDLKILALNLTENLDGVAPNYEASKILQDLRNQKKGVEKLLKIAQILEDLRSKSKDPSPAEFLIGELYWMADQREKGLQWFEKGLRTHLGKMEKPGYLSQVLSHFLENSKTGDLETFENFLGDLQKKDLKKKYLKATLAEYQGRTLLKRGKKKEGLEKILLAADLNNYTPSHFILIRLLMAHQAHSEGASLAKRILNNPRASQWDKKDARSLLYQIQIDAQDWKSLSESIVENLTNTTTLYNDSYTLFRCFDYARGEKGKNREKVLGHLQAYQGPKKGMVSYFIGLLYWEMRKYEKSLAALEICINAGLGKKSSRIFQKWHSALSKIEQEKISKTQEWWNQKLTSTLGALKRVSGDRNLTLAAVLILTHLKREKEALPYLDDLEKAYRAKGDVGLLSRIALAYLKAGASDKAEALIEGLLKKKYLSYYQRRDLQSMVFDFWLKSKNFEKLLDYFQGRLEEKADYYSLTKRLSQIKAAGLEKALIEEMNGRAKKIGKKATLLYHLLYEYYKYSNYKLSDEYLEKAIKAGGYKENGPLLEKWTENLQRRGLYYLKRKTVEDRARKVEEVQKLYPQDRSLNMLLAAIAIHLKDQKKGTGYYEKVLQSWLQSKNYSKALYTLDLYFQYGGDRKKGRALMEGMAQRPDLSYSYYKSIINRMILFEAQEGQVGPMMNLCKKWLRRKEASGEVLAYPSRIYSALEKKALLEKLVKAFSQEAEKNPRPLYFDFVVYVWEGQKKYPEMIQALERWKKEAPKDFYCDEKLGSAYLTVKDYKKALEIFEGLYKKSSSYNRHQYRRNLILCYVPLKEYKKAEALLNEYIKYERGSHRSLLFALEVYKKTNQFEKAISTCQKMAAKEYYSSEKTRWWLSIAELYEGQKDFKKALEIYIWIERLGSKQDAQKAKKAREKLQSKHFK